MDEEEKEEEEEKGVSINRTGATTLFGEISIRRKGGKDQAMLRCPSFSFCRGNTSFLAGPPLPFCRRMGRFNVQMLAAFVGILVAFLLV